MAGRSNCKRAAVSAFDTTTGGEHAACSPRPDASRRALLAIQHTGGEAARGAVSHLKHVDDGHAARASSEGAPRYICVGLAVIRI
jgi:hypothetical protein